MLSKQEISKLRGKLFRHLDGIVTAPSAYALKSKGVTDYLLTHKKIELKTLAEKFQANDGYLNVALRVMCSQGWLIQHVENDKNSVTYEVNEASKIAFEHFHLYEDVVALLRMSEKHHNRKFEMEPFLKLESTFTKYKNHFGLELSTDKTVRIIQDQIFTHIEGIILGPTFVLLGMSGMFHKYFMEARFQPEEFHKDSAPFGRLLDILAELGCFNKMGDSFEFTDEGLFFARRASAYGVTVSYIPTMRKLDELIFGDALVLKTSSIGAEEKHVDREMNVWGSGGAHTTYFKVVDEIIIDMFNRPIAEQPKGVLDMGCGNGEFLQHLFSVIETQTLRGKNLDEYPLTIIGVDYNEAALKVSRANLIQAGIWAKIIWGDIGNPNQLAADLKDKFNIDLKDLLNVRSFLDHNRIWEEPKTAENLRISSSTGAYVSNGRRLDNNRVSASLKEHFEKWTPYVKKFGLLLIELHTIAPELTSKNLGRTAATAYDATHGYSDQYIIEIEEFTTIMKEAGLIADMTQFKKFPDSDLATVSVNLYKSP